MNLISNLIANNRSLSPHSSIHFLGSLFVSGHGFCLQKNEQKVKNKNHAGIFGVPRQWIEKNLFLARENPNLQFSKSN